MILETATRLSPARVLAIAAGEVHLAFPDLSVRAKLALSSPYQPAVGDLVLAIGQEDTFYVIGVLQGSGKTVFASTGDIEFRTRGRIDLAAEDVTIRGPRVAIHADRLEVLARSVLERFVEAYRWVKGLFDLRSGRTRQRVDGTFHLSAIRLVQRAEKDVKIDGEKINLG